MDTAYACRSGVRRRRYKPNAFTGFAAAGATSACHDVLPFTIPCTARPSTKAFTEHATTTTAPSRMRLGPLRPWAEHATTTTAPNRMRLGLLKPWVHCCVTTPRAADEANEREDGHQDSAIYHATPDERQDDKDTNHRDRRQAKHALAPGFAK